MHMILMVLIFTWMYIEVKIMDIIKNISALIKVKTIVTLVVMVVFTVLALRGDIGADNSMIIISMVVSFYFGTQYERKGGTYNVS